MRKLSRLIPNCDYRDFSFVLLSLCTLVLLSLVGCERDGSFLPSNSERAADEVPAPVSPDPRLIVLISVDTLRADHLSLYGHHRFTSPKLELFAEGGTVFEDASTVAPWTLPAHASMLTGLYPLEHGVIAESTRLPEDIPTVAALLADQGWQTAAAVNSAWLLQRNFELTRGFENFLFVEDVAHQRFPTSGITSQGIRWIEELGDKNLFVFMHYYDVHSDYKSLQTFENLFVSPYDGTADGTTWQLQLASFPPEFVKACRTNPDLNSCHFGKGKYANHLDSSTKVLDFNPADLLHVEELYDAGIRQFDDEIGRLFDFLKSTGKMDSALIIITSDHGEEFLEHGSLYHYITTYQEVLHVPLILRGKGVPAGLRVEAPVSIVDILPTILSWAEVEPPLQVNGHDLTPLLKNSEEIPGTPNPSNLFFERFQYAEASGGIQWKDAIAGEVAIYSSIRQGNYKLIMTEGGNVVGLYNLEVDPHEKVDLALTQPSVLKALKNELDRRTQEIEARPKSDNQIELDPDEIEKLRALGYGVGD
jgi:arylsulfatase A-like enzyme